MFRSIFFSLIAIVTIVGGAKTTSAATISFSGEIDVVFADAGGAIYSGAGVGTTFSGQIDDVSYNGSVSDGTTTTSFGCCLAAAFEITNDYLLTAAEATILNSIQSGSVFSAGDLIDLVNFEGDVGLSNGNRFEAGLSFFFDVATFSDNSIGNYPFDTADLLFTTFFLLEEEDWLTSNNPPIYSALGLVDNLVLPFGNGGPPGVIPLPATLPLLLAGFGGLVVMGRRRRP